MTDLEKVQADMVTLRARTIDYLSINDWVCTEFDCNSWVNLRHGGMKIFNLQEAAVLQLAIDKGIREGEVV